MKTLKLNFESQELLDIFTSWLLDGGGEFGFIEHVIDNDFQPDGKFLCSEFTDPNDSIDFIFKEDG